MPMSVERVAHACDASRAVNVRERQPLGQLAETGPGSSKSVLVRPAVSLPCHTRTTIRVVGDKKQPA
jgi:hypothetical protein